MLLLLRAMRISHKGFKIYYVMFNKQKYFMLHDSLAKNLIPKCHDTGEEWCWLNLDLIYLMYHQEQINLRNKQHMLALTKHVDSVI